MDSDIKIGGATFNANDVEAVYGSASNKNVSLILLANGTEIVMEVPEEEVTKELERVLGPDAGEKQ